ncbi:Leucine-rich repeat,Leucine-rich repeat domain, L domain-like,Leucine-rich repeat, typical subtype [Cinara cedri]|uniref:Leucine-rich repeat,Leucine-rich repeat domain, L domain-like,Leucine-rich repeat, typical subtype n=1 Tax=Cinara cedri TaxID=506608 RepID=A0A5E4N8H5_9HEMI|nr:Leucine-rich repeat,Leucine-rich repeat domain, L domain-like,Leucine-rich repeat, typical subtype [Cinara cedri]
MEMTHKVTFRQVTRIVFNVIIQYLNFDDIMSLITALNLQTTRLDYGTIKLAHLNQVEYVFKNKHHFNYLGLVIFGVNLEEKKIKFNKSVKRLKLNRIQIYYIPDLNHLSNLQRLKITNNPIKTINKNISTSIEHLNLSYNKIRSMKNIDRLTRLKTLDLSCNYITKINYLDYSTQITELDLSNNGLQIIDGLSKLIHLTKLNLSNNKIKKIQNLAVLGNLKELILINNKIENLENLDNLTKIVYLNLCCNKVNRIQHLNNCRSLVILDLRNNKIDKIENLEWNRNLEILLLANNHISLLDNIFHLKNITVLDLGLNPIYTVDDKKLKDCFIHLQKLYLPNLPTLFN